MKKILILCSICMVVAQANAGNEIPGPLKDQQVTHSTYDTIIVPAGIITSFGTMYPNASNVMWYRYRPAGVVIEPGYWYSTLDTSDYYVSFLWNDDDYIAWYDNGSWIHSTQRIDNSEIPASVQTAIGRDYPGFVITDVDLEHDRGQKLYEVKLDKGNKRWNVHYTAEGMVVKKKSKDLDKITGETTMVSDFETRYPNAVSVTWYRYYPTDRVEVLPSDWDYTMDESDYEVHYSLDGSDYIAYYDNGRWVRSETMTYDRNKLPATVNNAIQSQYAGYTIKDVDREDDATRTVYEVELSKGTEKCKIHYATDGSIVKKKCRNNGIKTKTM